ncbi:MAG: SGNH/GDSL hydrolase family protein [Akkermansiaceae bacterium]|nr:SGNH/GDSL hydrolase family protein [Akkermansiaceae bacterium]
MKPWILSLLLISLAKGDALTFQNNDRVVLLGNTVVERAQKYGHLETALTLAAGEKNLRFRNLGWSGDTVYGDARSYFGPPQEGFDRLKADLGRIKPNVVIICYGAVASFEGDDGLMDFIKGYKRLLDMVNSAANPRAIVLVSPPPAESLGTPMPDMSKQNERLETYRAAISKLASIRKIHFADLFGEMKGSNTGLTDNGLHYTEKGYAILSSKLVKSMGLTPPTTKQISSKSGQDLRAKIVKKNKLFFFHWRPANETYLRLFRKHEQGNNAKELEKFIPIIEARESEIDGLKTATLKVKS